MPSIVLVAAAMIFATATMQVAGRFRPSGMPYTLAVALMLLAARFYLLV